MDQDVINLAKAIRQTESGGDFNAKGKSGESGAYQWTPATWKAHARDALGNENAEMTPSNQNAVAYTILKKRKDAGLNPAQIAAEWNSGSAQGWEEKRGTNKFGVQYDVPKYVKSVTDAYQQYKAGNPNPSISPNPSTTGGYNPTPFSGGGQFAINISGTPQAPQKAPETPASIIPNLGEVWSGLKEGLSGRAADLSGAGTTAAKGGVHIGTGAIQAAGAVAGGVGDLANAALQLVPGVQGAEKMLGDLIEGGMHTKTGQDVATAFSDFSKKNPEVAKTIGAGVNVLAAIPLLRGLGLVKSAVGDTATAAFRSNVEKTAKEEITDVLTTRPAAALSRAEKRGLDPVGFLTTEAKYLPDIVPNPSGGFMYSSKRGIAELEKALDADESKLQSMLDQAIKKNVMVSLTETRMKVLNDIRREYPLSPNYKSAVKSVNDTFDSVAEASGGRDMISLNELNQVKREVRNAVFDIAGDVRGTAAAEVKYNIGQSLMRQIEEIAEGAGAKGVRDLNKETARKIEAYKVLKAMDESKVKTKGGLGREAAVDVAGFGGEALGGAFGSPFAGTLASRGLTGALLRRAPRSAVGKLSRYKPPTSSLKKGSIDTAKGLGLQAVSTQATK